MYCVYFTIYFGNLLPKRYIGSSKIDRVNKGYNGSISSKRFAQIYRDEQKRNKKLFKTRVLSIHKTDKEAREKELELQIKYDVLNDERYMNESYAKINGFFGRNVSGELNPMYGKVHPSKNKKINSGNVGEKNPMYGKRGSDHPAYGYKRSEETNRKTSEKLKGKSKTTSHIENLKKSHRSEEYLRKVSRSIFVDGKYYSSIKEALEKSGKSRHFIYTRLKLYSNTEVMYANVY